MVIWVPNSPYFFPFSTRFLFLGALFHFANMQSLSRHPPAVLGHRTTHTDVPTEQTSRWMGQWRRNKQTNKQTNMSSIFAESREENTSETSDISCISRKESQGQPIDWNFFLHFTVSIEKKITRGSRERIMTEHMHVFFYLLMASSFSNVRLLSVKLV